MKTQISRSNFRPEKRYSGVYQQQGRMVVDADVNEQAEIGKKRLDNALRDVIDSGIPETGGMDIVSDGAGGIEIVPGRLYVDGIPAEIPAADGAATVPYSAQQDFPDPPPIEAEIQSPPASPPGPEGQYSVYADVWERTVLALEDGELVDPALHGADTCTRTQTMAQIKWCPANRNPEDTTYNPQRGNARLTLQLRDMITAADPCDPCAEQVNLESGSGNYLFRLEVHDFRYSPGGNRRLTLKWSGENGAEQYHVNNLPIDFNSGQWVYEFFNEAAEKHLGWHLASAPGFPERGVLTTDFSAAPGSGTHPYVRRWDGYLTLEEVAGQWSLATGTSGSLGIDRGVALSETSDPVSRLGDVNVGDLLVVNLSGLQLTLVLRDGGFDRSFVPGDFWQVPVREQEASLSPPELLLDDEEPHGIQHHYLLLAEVDGNTVTRPADLGCNRYAFPPLTNLTASRICFDNVCPELYGPDADNVQDALGNLCSNLDASDVAYEQPACPPGNPSATMNALLEARLGNDWPDVDGDGSATVRDVLDALLCRLTSSEIPLRKDDPGLCQALQPPGVATVHDALNVLCRTGGGNGGPAVTCSHTVGRGGEFETLNQAIEALQDGPAINLCLLPGEYELERPVESSGLRTISITGTGVASTVVSVREDYRLPASEVILRDLFVMAREGASLIVQAPRADVQHCRFERLSSREPGAPLVQIASERDAHVFWHGNLVTATLEAGRASDAETLYMPSRNVLGNTHRVRRGLRSLLALDPGAGEQAYERALSAVATDIAALPIERKQLWAREVPSAEIEELDNTPPLFLVAARGAPTSNAGLTNENLAPLRLTTAATGPQDAALNFYAVMGRANASESDVRDALDNVVKANTQTGIDDGLGLFSNNVGGVISDSVFTADIVLNAGLQDGIVLRPEHMPRERGGQVEPGANLRLSGNYCTRVLTRIPRSALDDNGQIAGAVPGYQSLQVNENVFTDYDSGLVATVTNMQANHFDIRNEAVAVALIVGNFGAFTANWSPFGAQIEHTIVDASHRSSTGNLLVNVP